MVLEYPLNGFEEVGTEWQTMTECFLLTTQYHKDAFVFHEMFKHLNRSDNERHRNCEDSKCTFSKLNNNIDRAFAVAGPVLGYRLPSII